MHVLPHREVLLFLYFVKYKPHQNIYEKFIGLNEIHVLSNTYFLYAEAVFKFVN